MESGCHDHPAGALWLGPGERNRHLLGEGQTRGRAHPLIAYGVATPFVLGEAADTDPGHDAAVPVRS